MLRLEVSGAVRPIYGSLGVKRLIFFHTMDSIESLVKPVSTNPSFRTAAVDSVENRPFRTCSETNLDTSAIEIFHCTCAVRCRLAWCIRHLTPIPSVDVGWGSSFLVINRLRVGCRRNHSLIPGRGNRAFLIQSVQAGSGRHPAVYLMVIGVSFSGDKATGA